MGDPYRGGHYGIEIRGIRLDVYRIARLYGVTHPCHFHALKKVLRAGRGHKPLVDDIDDVIATLQRWKAMLDEEQTWELEGGNGGRKWMRSAGKRLRRVLPGL